jgi:hypothetical protein
MVLTDFAEIACHAPDYLSLMIIKQAQCPL